MKKWLGYGILCLLIPAVVLGGALIFRDRQYAYITLCVAVLSCLPFFLHFERSANDVKRLILIAVMVALSVAGRMLFAPLQHFKPVTALVIITAMYFGSEAGFLTGALSAVLSNFYFGLFSRRNEHADVQRAVRAGSLDAVSDVFLGHDRLFQRAFGTAFAPQPHCALHLGRHRRYALFVFDGYLDSTVGRRLF